MSYITPETLQARFGAETQSWIDEGGWSDPARMAALLADVGALIDGHLAARYALPFDPPPPLLVGIAADLARERLAESAGVRLDETDPVRRAGARALDLLRSLARGDIVIGATLRPGLPQSPAEARMESAAPVRFGDEGVF